MGEPAVAGPPGGSTEQRILRSTAASYAIQLARLGINFGAKLALIWLVLPHGHGVYELALRIVTIAAAVRDLGLPYHLVRDPRKPYGTVFVFTAVSGALLTVLLIATSSLWGRLAPELPAVIRVFAVWVFIDGLAVVPRAFFEQQLTIGNLVAPEVWRGILLALVSVGLAWQGWGYWSFVIGDIAAAILVAAYCWWRARNQLVLKVDLGLVPNLVRHSFFLFLIWMCIQLVTYVDVFIVQWFLGADVVGLYARSYWLVFLAATFLYPRALFPALVKYSSERARLVEFFRLSTIQLLGLQVIGSYLLAVNAQWVVLKLFGPQWSGAVPMIQVLSFIPFFDQFSILGGELLKALHLDRVWLKVMILNLISLVGLGIFFVEQWGAVGMAAANYFLAGNLLMAWQVRKIFGNRAGGFFADLVILYLLPIPFFSLAVLLFPSGSNGRVFISLLAAVLSLAAFTGRYYSSFVSFFRPR